jgi:hypothetical protein
MNNRFRWRSSTTPSTLAKKMKPFQWTEATGIRDPQSGFKSRYYHEGKVALRHPISSKQTKHLAGYTLMEKDVRNLLEWINELKRIQTENGDPLVVEGDQPIRGDKTKNVIAKALFISLITVYGKLFTGAKGRMVSLNKTIYKESNFLAQHDELMLLRHNYTAHSGDERIEKCEVVIALAIKDGTLHHRLYTELGQPNHYSLDSYTELEELINYLHVKVKELNERAYANVKSKHLTNEELDSIIELYTKFK